MGLISQVVPTPRRVRGIFYGWWLVVISGSVMVIATVPLFHAMPVWAVALERHFGWNRTQLGLALTFTRVEGGIMGPLEGFLTDKLGTRRMVLIGLLILGLGFLLFGQVQNLWMFYLAYVVMALGQGLGSWLPMMTALNNWFVRRRTVAMGWSNTGSRLGALLLVPLIAWTINPDADRLGWSMTATILGIFILVVAVPISLAIRNRPADYGLLPDGDLPTPARQRSGPAAPAAASTQTPSDLTASQALRTPAFWLIAFGHGMTSMIILAIFAHLGLLMSDKGFAVETTGWVVAVYTGTSMCFQVVGGYVGDRMPKRLALFIFTSIQAGAVIILTFASNLAAIYIFAVVFGMGFGGRNPLTTAIRGEYFGRGSFGKILGLSTVPMNIMLLLAAPFAGFMRDVQGTYTTAFLVLAGLNFLGAVFFLLSAKPVVTPAPQTPQEALSG